MRKKDNKTPALQVRELPEVIYGRLKKEARAQHRSLARQTIHVLAKGLGLEENPQQRRENVISEIIANPPVKARGKLTDPAKLIREDRSR